MYTLTSEQQQIQQSARRLAQDVIAPRANKHNIDQQYPWDNVKDLTETGFMGMTVPKEYGGLGLNYFDTVLVVEEMAK
ncbi:MAG: acyl-CoA dehydrogenase family protein, partial [Proteobacteria bacterium]|nr:acyl-CoA dehydrogenase family protein [Pseudomonadota bacterium]